MFDGMDPFWKKLLWEQLGAGIDTMENAIRACPEKVWGDRSRRPEYWYLVYHALFFLDLYLSDSVEGFAPPPPFTLSEMDPSGVMPDRVYTQAELLKYLEHSREKARDRIRSLTDEKARQHCKYGSVDGTVADLLLYNLRHLQHHAAQLNLILRQTIDSAPHWVFRARQPL